MGSFTDTVFTPWHHWQTLSSGLRLQTRLLHTHSLVKTLTNGPDEWLTIPVESLQSRLDTCVQFCMVRVTFRDMHTRFVSWSQFHQTYSQHKFYPLCIYTTRYVYTIAIKLCVHGFLVLQIISHTHPYCLFGFLYSNRNQKIHIFLTWSKKDRKQHQHTENACPPSVTGNLLKGRYGGKGAMTL